MKKRTEDFWDTMEKRGEKFLDMFSFDTGISRLSNPDFLKTEAKDEQEKY